MRENVHRTVETVLCSGTADTPDPRNLSKKARKSAAGASADAAADERVLLSFEDATLEMLDLFVTPPSRVAHGGKTSESNIALEARSDRLQLASQVAFWRSLDEEAVTCLKSLESADADHPDEPYWRALAMSALASGLPVPSFQAAYNTYWSRNPCPSYDKDHQFRNTGSTVSVATMVATETPVQLLRKSTDSSLLLNTVLVDFMVTVRYLSKTRKADVVLPATTHWLPDPDPSTLWERNTAADAVLQPKETLFAELTSWTLKTKTHLTRRPTNKQMEKANVLLQALDVRIQRAMWGLTYGSPSQDPRPEDYGWRQARIVLLAKKWISGIALGRHAKKNYLILAAIYYRVNHGLEEMYKEQRIVDDIDREQYQREVASGLHQQGSAAPIDEEARAADEAASREEDSPPAFEELAAAGADDLTILFAQYQYRFDSVAERMKNHYAKQPPLIIAREVALDKLHAWKRFVYSHLNLARALLDGERCDDAFALEENLAEGRLSRLSVNYPEVDCAPGEELLRNLSDRFRLIDAIYAAPNGSAAGTATATAAAQVTTRAGADEVPRDEVVDGGMVMGSVRTAADTTKVQPDGEPLKRPRGRPPNNPGQPKPPKPPKGTRGRGRPRKNPLPTDTASSSVKVEVKSEPIEEPLPLPLPLFQHTDAPKQENPCVDDAQLAEEMAIFNGAEPQADPDDDAELEDDGRPALGDATIGVPDMDALLAADGDGDLVEPGQFNQYESLIETLRQSEELMAREEEERKRRASQRNVIVGRHGAMGVPVGSGAPQPSGTPGCSHPVRPRVSIHSNYWAMFLRKILPRPCADREFSSRCDHTAMAYPECYDFVVESLCASLLGLYRHCRNPAPFDLALKISRVQDLSLRYDACRHIMLAIMFAHNELIIASLRENLVWQMGNDPSIWMLNGAWIQGATHVARAIFHYQRHIGGVENAIARGYGAQSLFSGTDRLPSGLAVATGEPVAMGEPAASAGSLGGRKTRALNEAKRGEDDFMSDAISVSDEETAERKDNNAKAKDDAPNLSMPSVPHRPSIFRVSHNNFVYYLELMFRFVAAEAVLCSAAHRLVEYNRAMDGLTEQQRRDGVTAVIQGPSVYRISEAAYHMVLAEAQALRPNSHIPVASLERIGVSPTGRCIIIVARELFRIRAHDQTVRSLLCSLRPLDFELCSVFFRALWLHTQRAIVPLDYTTTRRQEAALRAHWRVPADKPIPMHVRSFGMCHVGACRELKNLIVQQTGATKEYGAFWGAADSEIGDMVCLSKRGVGTHFRNTTVPPELRTPWTAHLDPELLKQETPDQSRARLAKVFYGQFQLLGEEPRSEPEDARQRTYPSQSREIAARLVIFAEAVIRATGGRARAEPLDLISDDALAEKLRAYSVSPTAQTAVENAQRLVREACTKESRMLEEGKYMQECFRSRLLWAPALGYAVAVEGKKLAPYTPASVCPHCGALTIYSIAPPLATGPNGFSCGVCDWHERERFHAPRCVVCHQNCLELELTSKGQTRLRWVKELKQIRILDDISGGGMEFRVAFVCWACSEPWMFADYRQGASSLGSVPLTASMLIAGSVHRFDVGGRYSIRQSDDISVRSMRALPTVTVAGEERPAIPPQSLVATFRQWEKSVTRAQLREQKKEEKRIAALERKAKRARKAADNNSKKKAGGVA